MEPQQNPSISGPGQQKAELNSKQQSNQSQAQLGQSNQNQNLQQKPSNIDNQIEDQQQNTILFANYLQQLIVEKPIMNQKDNSEFKEKQQKEQNLKCQKPQENTCHEQKMDIEFSHTPQQTPSQKIDNQLLSEQELILKALQLQYSLQLIGLQQKQKKYQNFSVKDNLMKKQLKLNGLIEQIKETIEELTAEDSQQNKQFIQEYQFKLNEALQLKSCYQSFIKIHQKPNLQDQLVDHLKFFGMESKPIDQALEELRKKKKLNIKKIEILKKKNSNQEIKKIQDFNNKIDRLQQLSNQIRVSESKNYDKQYQKLQQEPKQNPGNFKNQTPGNFIQNVPEFDLIFYEKGVQCLRIKINQSITISQVLRELKIDPKQKNFNFYYRNNKLNKKQLIDIDMKIGQFICQPIQNDCYVQIEQYITIKLDNNDVKRFQKGTSLFEIQKRLGIKSKDFHFFSNYKEYTIEDALHNLEIRQCEVFKVKYLGKVLKYPIPRKISFKEVIKYIQFEKYNSQIVQTIYIAKVKVQGKELDVNQSITLQQFSLSLINQEVEQLIVQYKIILKISIQSFQQQVQMVVSSRNQIFEIKQKLQKICKIDKKIQKWNHAGMELQNQKSFQQLGLIKSEIKIQVVQKKYKPIMTFFVESMEIGKIPIQLHKNIKQHMISLSKQQLINGNNKYYLKSRLEGQTTQIPENQNLNNVLDLKNLFSYEFLYECSIQQLIQIKLDNNQIKYFKKGVQLNTIRDKLKIKGRKYIFFKDFRQFNQVKTQQNLELRQCYICNVKYLNKQLNQVIVPNRVKFCQLIKYIQFQNIYSQTIQTIKIVKLRLSEEKKLYYIEPNQTISVFLQNLKCEAKIQDIILGYVINLKLQVITNNYKQALMSVNSKETILQLKQKFEQSCKLDKKLQKWSYEGALLANNKNFEDHQIFQSYVRIQVNEIKNLQYYGFQTEDPIDSNIYTNYYVQDDDQFKRQLEKSSFPDKQFEYSFRIKSTNKVFSCIKKHGRIKTGIDSIKSIVANSSKGCDLWMPASAEDQTLFNQTYVLFNILNSSEIDLIIEICKTYKNHSPLPIKTKRLNGSIKDLSEAHYWISTKSINMVSLQLGSPVKGKSTFLNQIFNTDFITELKHPICQNTAFIKYDIYRNTRYLVDLIDVSTNSMTQDQKITLCKHANILIVHLYEKQFETIKKWIDTHCSKTPIIYIYRDSNLMKNEQYFKIQMMRNNEFIKQKHFHLLKLNRKTFTHYEYKFCQISDCINKFIIEIESKESQKRKWLLNNYFQKSNPRLAIYTKKLRNLEKQFSTLVNLDFLFQNKTQDFKLSETIFDLISIQVLDDITKFMAKMKQFSRIQRARNLYEFTSTLMLLKGILEQKNDWKIQERKDQIQNCFKVLQEIDLKKKTKVFQEGLQIYRQFQKLLTYEKLQQIYKKYLKSEFDNTIEKKQFSIQNFWRILLYFYTASQQMKQNPQFNKIYGKLVDSTQKIFALEFQKGKTIQLINGDTLEMPMKLFRNHQNKFKGKQIMVVAIVGGQSSGKSNLLNFLFGCDFLSSEGRCTSGVYFSYYELSGQNIKGCNGIVVLDTQGLFSNVKRKNEEGKNFDNKLVLFLLKTVDILIVNCRGDIQSNIQDILQLSFDSELMKYEPGVKYPHFNIVLNMKTDVMSSQNKSQIQILRERIVEANQQMQKYISSDQSNSLPIAFGSKTQSGVQKYLNQIQSSTKIATRQFYEGTRKLSLNLVKILTKRGNTFNSRGLADIYEQMYSTWSMLIRLPILTNHMNRRLKLFDDEIQNYIKNLNIELQQKSKMISRQIPNKILQIDGWMQIKEQFFHDFKDKKLIQFQKQFMSRSPQTSSMANLYKNQIQSKLSTFESNLKLQITQKKYKLALTESQNRGINDLNKKARALRCKNLTKEEQNEQFQKFWNLYTQDIIKKIDPIRNSKQIFHNVQFYYNDHIKLTNKIRLSQAEYENQSGIQYQKYFQIKLQQFNTKIHQINPLEAVQIPPVIAISQNATTDLKCKYFDMKTFFQPVPTRFNYYINYHSLIDVIDFNTIIRKSQFEIKKSFLIINFFQLLQSDLRYLSVTINLSDNLKNALLSTFKKKQSSSYANNLAYLPYQSFKIDNMDDIRREFDKIISQIQRTKHQTNSYQNQANKTNNKKKRKNKKKKKQAKDKNYHHNNKI